MERHLGALIVGAFAVVLVVIVLLQLLEEGDVAEWLAEAPEEWAYVLCFGSSGSMQSSRSSPARRRSAPLRRSPHRETLELELVMVAGALGAIVGDSSLFWIARKSAARVQGQLDKALENPKVRAGWDALDRSPGLMIVAGRYVPGMRFAVNATMGLSSLPYRRFLPWSVLGGTLWSVYTCTLAYNVATTLSGFPLASLVISSLITSAALAAIYFVDRRRRRSSEGCRPSRCERGACGPAELHRIGRVVDRHEAPDSGLDDRARVRLTAAVASARSASTRHVSLAVPFRAAERNRRVAASVLAGGIAYRLFLWLLPLGLILGGALGLMDADSTEEALASGGLPAAVVDVIGDVARAAESDWWWLLGIGVPLLLWAGYSGAKAVQLIHSLIWDEPPPRAKPLTSSLAFTGVLCAFMAAFALTWWLRDEASLERLLAATLATAPLAAFWLWASLRLPHRDAPWRALLPGAILVAVGLQVLHVLIVEFLAPKLENATTLYGSIGAMTTILFFMYFAGRLVVTSPILNSSLHHELRAQSDEVATMERRRQASDEQATRP